MYSCTGVGSSEDSASVCNTPHVTRDSKARKTKLEELRLDFNAGPSGVAEKRHHYWIHVAHVRYVSRIYKYGLWGTKNAYPRNETSNCLRMPIAIHVRYSIDAQPSKQEAMRSMKRIMYFFVGLHRDIAFMNMSRRASSSSIIFHGASYLEELISYAVCRSNCWLMIF